MKKFQVVIVGGGPVGVALAVQLGIRGISCALVESRTELGRIPKGQNLTHRTLEHFYFMGIVDELRAARFLPPGSSRLLRVHGPLVTEEEVIQVVEFLKKQGKPAYNERILETPEERAETGEGDAGSIDELYDDARRIVIEMGKASTSVLQRRLRIGYGRAASLLDAMERDGLIGPPDGTKPRELLVNRDDYVQ